MKTGWLLILLFLGIGNFWNISARNTRAREAQAAYQAGNFEGAVEHYEFLVYELKETEPKMLLNLAHAYYKNQQLEKAQKTYEKCLKDPSDSLRSVAWSQLGNLNGRVKDYQKALTFYKRALVANPGNEEARYNYEMLKKFLHENPEEARKNQPQPQQQKPNEQPQDKKPQDQQQQSETPNPEGDQEKDDPNQQEKGDQQQQPDKQTTPPSPEKPPQEKPAEGENATEKEQKSGTEKGNELGQNRSETEEQPKPGKPNQNGGKEAANGNEQRLQTQYERLRKANISPEQAEMMLNAMRAAEQQYLQQLPKKPTKPQDRTKPDW